MNRYLTSIPAQRTLRLFLKYHSPVVTAPTLALTVQFLLLESLLLHAARFPETLLLFAWLFLPSTYTAGFLLMPNSRASSAPGFLPSSSSLTASILNSRVNCFLCFIGHSFLVIVYFLKCPSNWGRFNVTPFAQDQFFSSPSPGHLEQTFQSRLFRE